MGQWLWGLGVILDAYGLLSQTSAVTEWGVRLFGASFAWYAFLFVRGTRKKRTGAVGKPKISMALQSRLAWVIAWAFAGILGVLTVFGLNPMSLVAIHLLFLGWVTTLIYAIGYAMFPLLLGKQARCQRSSIAQVVTSSVGSALLITSFSAFGFSSIGRFVSVFLTIGGVIAAGGAIWFIIGQILTLIRSRKWSG
ncbi:hypothetical protein [Alicyclobacillus acidoterrestris]|uniref:Uncharacterized protein n=1 Tax=Alicyclobacillus acidoterrestris (strain ATCC 49025 / DSM 3922 / CIP 106132 / NCIMB 13137 / GD3B) TaxID=1356854 RepID=A0A9E6ZFL3_ALIAG|nr:hypothetical protein [Alicyclobacillus acidoterrestris]UNO47203.1 hypothetical protein K1I37_10635 [Alicyclobacillus acidoterrestris]